MNLIGAVILGLLQGLTEFLPVSSSGHLVIGEYLLGLRMPGVTLEIWLHLGTLLAVLVYFRRSTFSLVRSIFLIRHETDQSNRQLALAIIIGSIPAAVVGVLFKAVIEEAFSSAQLAAAMLLITGAILIISNWARNQNLNINIGRGFIVGLAQAAAILPGISRSGSTISVAMLMGVDPSRAAEFSFLLSIPAVGGAFLFDLISSGREVFHSGNMGAYIIGMAVSFGVGYLSIHYLLKIIRRGRFYIFGFYCLAVGALSLIYLY